MKKPYTYKKAIMVDTSLRMKTYYDAINKTNCKIPSSYLVSNTSQCLKMKSHAICCPTGLFCATLLITNVASEDLIFVVSNEK